MSSRKPTSPSKNTGTDGKNNGGLSSMSSPKKSEKKRINNRSGRLTAAPAARYNYAGYNGRNFGGLSTMPPLDSNYTGYKNYEDGRSSMQSSQPSGYGYSQTNGITTSMPISGRKNAGYNRMIGGGLAPGTLTPRAALDDKYLKHNKFVKYYMDQPYRPSRISERADCNAEPPTIPQAKSFLGQDGSAYIPTAEELRKANEAVITNSEFGVIRRPEEPNLDTLCGSYRSRGKANRVLNRSALNKELCQMPFLYHIYNPNKLLSQYYCRDRDGPSRVAPGLGLGFLSRPNRSQYRRLKKRGTKSVPSVPICCPPATYEFNQEPCMLHYRLLNGPRLREELQTQPLYKEALDPYKVAEIPDCDELYGKLVRCFDDVPNKPSILDMYCRCCREGQRDAGKDGGKGGYGGPGGAGGRGGLGADDDGAKDGKDGKTGGRDGRFGGTSKVRTGKDVTGKDETGADVTGKDGTGKDGTGKDVTGKDATGKGDQSKFGDGKAGKGDKDGKGGAGDEEGKDGKGAKADKDAKGGKDGKGGKEGKGGKGDKGDKGDQDKEKMREFDIGEPPKLDYDADIGDRKPRNYGESFSDQGRSKSKDILTEDGGSTVGPDGLKTSETDILRPSEIERAKHKGSKSGTGKGKGKGKKGKRKKKKTASESEEKEEFKECPCPICDMNRKAEPPPAWMTEMIQEQNKRDLMNYYKRMKQKECEMYQTPKYPAPQHRTDPIKCSNDFCQSKIVADATECLRNLELLHHYLDPKKKCIPKHKEVKKSECWDPNCMELDLCKIRKALQCDCEC